MRTNERPGGAIVLDRSAVLCAVVLLAVAVLLVHNRETLITWDDPLTPDSVLYTGLARNLMEGRGYVDTIRKDEILPPIGHPLLLAVAFTFGVADVSTLVSVIAGVLATMVAAFVCTRRVIPTLAVGLVLVAWARETEFYTFGIEASGYLVAGFLVHALTRAGSREQGRSAFVMLGVVLGMYTLVRPLFLQLTILVCAALAGMAAWKRWGRGGGDLPPRWRQVWLATATALAVSLSMTSLSLLQHGDTRYTRGTYAAMNLFLANNPYLPANVPYSSGLMKNMPAEERNLVLQNPDGWKNRESRLLHRTMAFILSNPRQAAEGWLWRLGRQLGAGHHYPTPLFFYRAMAITLWALMAAGFALKILARRRGHQPASSAVAGAYVVGALFYYQIALQMIFSWTGPRYLCYAMPFLALSWIVVAVDVIQSARLTIRSGAAHRAAQAGARAASVTLDASA